MRAGYSVVASSANVLGWAFFLRELGFSMREAFILRPFLPLNTTKIISYGHVHALTFNARFEGKNRRCGLMRDVAQAAAFELVPTEAAGPQENPEPRFQDEFVALEVAQFFFVRRQISSIIKSP